MDNIINICNEFLIILIFLSLIIIDLLCIGDYSKLIWGWIVVGLLLISFLSSLIMAIKQSRDAKIIPNSKTKKKIKKKKRKLK